MAARFQLVIDRALPDPLARFWAAALVFQFEPPPSGFDSWDDYWRDFGLPDEDLGLGEDRITDPAGRGPGIWFQVVPERKAVKNRLHLDITVTGGRDGRGGAAPPRDPPRAPAPPAPGRAPPGAPTPCAAPRRGRGPDH